MFAFVGLAGEETPMVAINGAHVKVNFFALCNFQKYNSDENECANGTICGPNSICVNTPGSYICKCEKGNKIKDYLVLYKNFLGYQMKSGTINECVDIGL
jgi:hypothetical protein